MKKRFLISGGGTGGHIFPAIAIANRVKKDIPDAEILFVGSNQKMEMQRVPAAGYHIKGIDIYGICRDFSFNGLWHNIKLPFVLLKSLREARRIIRTFNPDVAIGVGGFASAPALQAAISLGVPALIQEQNSYPGVTNKLLSRKVKKICVAYEGLDRYFPASKIVITGNPIREELLNIHHHHEEAYAYFGLQADKKTLLVMGGSLGARAINECMREHIATLANESLNIIWQTGEQYYRIHKKDLKKLESSSVTIMPFIEKMNHAYSVADIIISRAGALAIAELSVVGTPSILIPFPFAAEDHQTKNAKALADQGAAILVADQDVPAQLLPSLLNLIHDENLCRSLSENMKLFAKPNAMDLIFNEIMSL
ncbi:MAG: undecaprenyldiphospho-muramoylpentapeptide beta-N-acetylglucosaminyltransferase [Bacteroidales bacterium]|nr:undecaprenyldiphospho-muramoylpentapeptide beta-N-acetylglucosaminyltransferase [Bacteroidales bacterium]